MIWFVQRELSCLSHQFDYDLAREQETWRYGWKDDRMSYEDNLYWSRLNSIHYHEAASVATPSLSHLLYKPHGVDYRSDYLLEIHCCSLEGIPHYGFVLPTRDAQVSCLLHAERQSANASMLCDEYSNSRRNCHIRGLPNRIPSRPTASPWPQYPEEVTSPMVTAVTILQTPDSGFHHPYYSASASSDPSLAPHSYPS